MKRTVKVFATGSNRAKLEQTYPVVESYKACVLLNVSGPEEESRPSLRCLGEHITAQDKIRVAGRVLRATPKASRMLPGAKREKLSPGPHHYLVTFIGPIKPAWLQKVRRM